MCGRISAYTPPARIARVMEARLAPDVDPEGRPSWNVPPTRLVYAVADDRFEELGVEPSDEGPHRVLAGFRWGLVPHWATDPRVGYRMINARAETIAIKPAYRSLFGRLRCLVVADGFYEWRVPDPTRPRHKVPYYFERADGRPLAFAGLWSTWHDKGRPDDPEAALRTCTIVTTQAGPDVAFVHDRMPVIVEADRFDEWLDATNHDTESLSRLLVPAPGGILVSHPVDPTVNSPRNDGPDLIREVPPAP